MSRRKTRTRRQPKADRAVRPASDRPGPGWRGLATSVLICGGSGALVGAAIDAALRTDGYALPAAMIGGIPAGAIGVCALGWYGRLFGARKRIRNGALIGGSIGLLGAGALGMVAGLWIWALPWSLAMAIVGAAIPAARPGRRRDAPGMIVGATAGATVGILVRAVRTGPADVLTDAIDGTIVGAVLGALLIPTLLAWLSRWPELLRRRRAG